VRFVAFTAEEIGLVGSKVYAQDVRSRGDKIIGVINLDMIAYADRMPEDLEVIVNGSSSWLAARFVAVASDYGLVGARQTIDASMIYSDHSPFWDRGYPAVLIIEDTPLINPEYHKTTDTIDTLNSEFYAQASQAALAALAELAQPIRPGYPATPTGLAAVSYRYVTLFGAVRNNELSWNATSGAAGYNIYRRAAGEESFRKINPALIKEPHFLDPSADPKTSYTYRLKAVDSARIPKESDFSQDADISPLPVKP